MPVSVIDDSLGFLCTLDFVVPIVMLSYMPFYMFFNLLSVSHSFVALCLVFVSAVVHSLMLCCLIGVLKNMYVYV